MLDEGIWPNSLCLRVVATHVTTFQQKLDEVTDAALEKPSALLVEEVGPRRIVSLMY